MRDSNDDKAWSESAEKDVSALSAQCSAPIDHSDAQLGDNATHPATSTRPNREAARARTRPSHIRDRGNSQRSTPGRVVWVVGIGLGAGLSALVYSQRSPSTASDVSAATAASERPAANAEPAREQASGGSQFASTTTSAPEELVAPQEGAAISAEAPPQPMAAETAPIDSPPSAAATMPSDSPAPAPSHEGAAPAAIEPARAARPTSTSPVIKITKLTEPAPPPDSEEARLAAAAVRRGEDNPTDALLDDAFAQGQERAKQELAARNAPPAIPLLPTRDDVITAMRALLPAIHDCAQGQTGIATANLVVSNDGKVQIVGIIGQAFGGTDRGHCMEGVVKSAQLPRFQQPSFRAQFPFSVQ